MIVTDEQFIAESVARAEVVAGRGINAEQTSAVLALLDEARRVAHRRQGEVDAARAEVGKLRAVAERAAALVVFADGVGEALRAAGIEPVPDTCGLCDQPYVGHCDDCGACPGTAHEDMCGMPDDEDG